MSPKSKLLLSLSSALILWLAWPPIPFTSPLLLIGMVPLLILIEHIITDGSAKKGKQVFRYAFLCFLVWNTLCIYWVYNAISFGNNPIVAFLISLIPYGLGALLMALAFWLYYRMRLVTGKLISFVGLVAFWISYEYLHQSWQLSFPWMTLGNGFATSPQLIQWYEYTGVYGGSLWILVSNILLFIAWQYIKASKAINYTSLRPALLWLVVIILPIGLSLKRYYSYEEKSNPSNIVVVQPNIDPYEKVTSSPVAEQINILTHLSDSIGQTNTEYFIWPETAISDYTNEETIRADANFLRVQQFIGKYKNGNVLSGIESKKFYNDNRSATAEYVPQLGQYVDHFNAAVQIENSARVQFYHKSKLVPGVEQMPFATALSFLKPVFAHFGGTVGGYGKQEQAGTFYSQSGIGVVPAICYESIWGDWVAQGVKGGGQFIAIITNDGWWGNTSGKDQHLLYARLRAIETRRWVARSANTGISAFINQRGDIVKQSKWWTRTALKQDINLSDELTAYVKYGDLIAKMALALFGAGMALLILAYFKSRYKKQPLKS